MKAIKLMHTAIKFSMCTGQGCQRFLSIIIGSFLNKDGQIKYLVYNQVLVSKKMQPFQV